MSARELRQWMAFFELRNEIDELRRQKFTEDEIQSLIEPVDDDEDDEGRDLDE